MFNLYIALCLVIKTLLGFNRQIEEQQMELNKVEIDNIAAYVFFSQLNTLPTL